MIRISKPGAPVILRNRGSRATKSLCDDFDSASDAFLRGEKRFEFDASLYGAKSVKTALHRAQHEKCAFCEAKITHIAYGDVEHFRPKGGYHQRAGEPLEQPGYYWLAYAWSNLYFSCQICNQRHKKNLFPLAVPGQRAKTHRHRLEDETPLLVDCGVDDPEAVIGFREEYAYAIDGNARANATIEILGINRDALIEARRGHLNMIQQLQRLIELLDQDIHQSLKLGDPDVGILRVELTGYQSTLRNMTERESVYSSMVRAALNMDR
jgi:uncharacterized protein (TIGR02646 family)